MPLTSTITAYDPSWPDRYAETRQLIEPIFGDAFIDCAHVGSTAVPDLAAKPEIDVLVVVEGIERADEWTDGLAACGYVRGRDHSPGHLFYRRDVDGIRTHKIHVCLSGHSKINDLLDFRDHLRSHPDIRQRYEALKLALEAQNTEGIGEYLTGKAPFIEDVLAGLRD